jgi:mono/diheme cytochrome c family protein
MSHSCRSLRGGYRCFWRSLWIALLLTACGGLGSEPHIVATLPPATLRVADMGLPTEHPDLRQGALIYAENCTRCHGPSGQGNGQLVLSGQLAEPPPDFTDPATTQAQSPGQWFETITKGRIDKLMPPWGDSRADYSGKGALGYKLR